jgi:hypothetical protein
MIFESKYRNKTTCKKVFEGQNYRYVVLKKVVLYPQKSGKLDIEPLSMDIDVQLPSNRRDVLVEWS